MNKKKYFSDKNKEFVEDKESLSLLEKMGADYIQGYYIGKPQKELQ